MAIRCSSRKPVQSVIHWPAVRAAGGLACFMVLVSMAAIWAQQNVNKESRNTGKENHTSCLPAFLIHPAVVEAKSEIRSTKSETNSKHEIPNEESIPTEGILQYPEAIAGSSPVPLPLPVPVPDSGKGTGKGELGDKNAEGSCQSSDSVLEFARDPMEAARLAREEHKLMFVLHVSGNFEESKFT